MKLQLVVLAATMGATSAFCPSYCSGHGECTENDICACFPGFGEADCSVRSCPSGLSWVVGTSSELSELPTPNGPAGKHPYTECSSRGTCDRATGECECFPGYTGKACRRSACPNQCSGHGLCVADGDVRSVMDGVSYYGGDDDFLLSPQKQYWNAKMSHQCICDQQYTGYDCSTRICPVGLDPSTSCDDAAAYSDVQAVSVLFGGDTMVDTDSDGFHDHADTDSDGLADHAAPYLPHNVEQFLTLTFTSQFNAQYETPPISYWDTAATVQQALISLPNFAIADVQVYKMFPRDTIVDSDSDGLVNNGESDNTGRCANAYFREYQSTLCSTDSDCGTMFPSLGDNVFCDVDIQACVETELACAYQDGEVEFSSANCALDFEIDGLYRTNGEDPASDGFDSATYYWGHRLTAFERNCQAGKFAPTDTKYALPCAADSDCVACAGWTQVRNGVCLDSGYCGSLVADGVIATNSITEITTDIDGAQHGCSVATFVVKFSDSSTPGVQNDLECTISNTDAVEPGASPMYRSAGLNDCSVTHIGVPAFTDGKIQDPSASTETTINNELALCVAISDADLDTSMVASADCTDGSSFNRALSMDDINAGVAVDNGNVASVEGGEYPLAPNFAVSGTDAVYTSEEIDAKTTAAYDIAMPCSNKGACDYATGICQCSSGFTGSACQIAITYV